MSKQRTYARWVAAILAGLFLCLCLFMITGAWTGSWDVQSMLWLQALISSSADLPLSVLSLAGSTEVTLSLSAGIFYWMLRRHRKAFYGLSFLALIFLIELGGKFLLTHPRPPAETIRYVPIIRLPASSYVQLANSFPSGHMARTTFIAAIALFLLFQSRVHRRWKIAGGILTTVFLLVVFVSRMSLGVHWLSDVAGGMLLGALAASLAISVW